MNQNAEPQTDISLDTNPLETTETHQPSDHPFADVANVANVANIELAAAVDEDADDDDDDTDAEGTEADDDASDEVKAETEDSDDGSEDASDRDDSDSDDSDSDDSDVDDSDIDDSDIEGADVDDQGANVEGFVQVKAEAEGDEDPADEDTENTENTDDDDREVTAEADPAETGEAQIQAESADEAVTEHENDAEDDEAASAGSDDSESNDGDDDEDPHGEFDENGQRVVHSAIDPLDEEDTDHDSDNNEDADDPANMAWTVDDLLASLQQDVHQHGLQCAYELEQQFPNDRELQIAGLVHDVAHRISSEAMHGIVAADLVRPLYGDRVASLVELHVDAKRYLVTVDPNYQAILSPESVHTLMLQGSTMDAAEQLAFENNHHFGDAVTLRRADDAAKVPGRSVPDLAYWEPILRSAAVNEEIHVAA